MKWAHGNNGDVVVVVIVFVVVVVVIVFIVVVVAVIVVKVAMGVAVRGLTLLFRLCLFVVATANSQASCYLL